MIGALWTGISGLSAQQTALDNEAHNIANVNTVGYKSSRISFADQMYQDKIGKGSKSPMRKKSSPGNLKVTGILWSCFRSGFCYGRGQPLWISWDFYTRRKLPNGRRWYVSAGNRVQGWRQVILIQLKMFSTNPNVSFYNLIIRNSLHQNCKTPNYIEIS